jgi:hypothetical protein
MYQVIEDAQGPLKFIKKNNGLQRGLGHLNLRWDFRTNTVHEDTTICSNGDNLPCNPLGWIRHAGPMFQQDNGLPVTAKADIVGLVGGFGWILKMNQGAPKSLRIQYIEVRWSNPLLLHIQYPIGTSVTITANAETSCTKTGSYSCKEVFQKVSSISAVRSSLGNTYYIDSITGFLTVRIIQFPKQFTGNPSWILPKDKDLGRDGNWFAVDRFERAGIYLPAREYGHWITIDADCVVGTGDRTPFCADFPQNAAFSVCVEGYEQVAYDKCCSTADPTTCIFADGSYA